MAARRILVTGSSGLLGRHVVAALVAAGHHVHAVDRAPFAGPAEEDAGEVSAAAGAAAGIVNLGGQRGVDFAAARARARRCRAWSWGRTPSPRRASWTWRRHQ